jgi:hypothetical protein
MLPHYGKEEITSPEFDGVPIFHNSYERKALEDYVMSLEGVKGYSWQRVPKDKDYQKERILHIYKYNNFDTLSSPIQRMFARIFD